LLDVGDAGKKSKSHLIRIKAQIVEIAFDTRFFPKYICVQIPHKGSIFQSAKALANRDVQKLPWCYLSGRRVK
jgi:hypothetical protein